MMNSVHYEDDENDVDSHRSVSRQSPRNFKWTEMSLLSLPESGQSDPIAPGANERVFPSGSCDCHLHVFGAGTEFPFAPERSYTPLPASMAAYWRAYRPIGIERCVFVQPSVYGRDHGLLKKTLDAAEPGTMRGVAVVFEDTTEQQIEALHRSGVRGARCNALFAGGVSIAGLRSVADRIRDFGWHIQLLVDVEKDPAVVGHVAAMGLPVVVDHFGHPSMRQGIDGPGFGNLLDLVADGQAWVKFSGAYRTSATATADDPAILPFAHALVQANPHRILWGSDWPHPGIEARNTTSPELARTLSDWLPARHWQQVLVDNPTRLYWNDR